MMMKQQQLMKIWLTSCPVLLSYHHRHQKIVDVRYLCFQFLFKFDLISVELHSNDFTIANNPSALSRLTPGAYSSLPTTHKTNSIEDSLSLDISQLRQHYKKLKERNKQVQIIIQSTNFFFLQRC